MNYMKLLPALAVLVLNIWLLINGGLAADQVQWFAWLHIIVAAYLLFLAWK